MLRNYFTLCHAAMELHEALTGGRLTEISSQEKNEVTLSFSTPECGELQLTLVTHTPRLAFYTRSGTLKKARNSASLLSEVWGLEVSGVEIAPADRIITIHLADRSRLVMQLFSANTNLLLVREERVVNAFKQKNSLVGTVYASESETPSILRELETLAMKRDRFRERFNSATAETLTEQLSLALPGFDRTLVREILKRAGEEAKPEDLFTIFQSLFYELLDPKVQVAENEQQEPLFTLLHTPLPGGRTFNSVLEGVNDYSFRVMRLLDTNDELKALRSKLQQQLKKARKEHESFNAALLEEFIRNYERSGHLLMASLYLPRLERKSITVPNILDPDNPEQEVTIALKEALTLQENAEHYFSLAAKTRGKLKAMQERHIQLAEKITSLEAMVAETDTISSPKEARTFLKQESAPLKKAGALPKKNAPATLPFRVIPLSPTVTLLVGKNAENNELLTFSHAKPNDIWLHARGAAGSHCVLKGAKPDQQNLIRKAAEIAAWYSAAKHAKLVPVIYTQKKYVRHGKKLAVGQVIVEREEVVMVRPKKEGE